MGYIFKGGEAVTKKKIFGILIGALITLISFSFLIYTIVIKVVKTTEQNARIESYIKSEKYEEALKYIDELLSSGNRRYSIYFKKGYALIQLDRNEEAVESLKSAYKFKPGDSTNLNYLSWAFNNLGKYEEALDYSTRALAEKPDYIDAIVNRGNALYGLNRYEEAVKEYGNALKLNPKHDMALWGMGITKLDEGKYKEAADNFLAYNEIVPDDVDSYICLAQAYYYNHDYPKAISCGDKALEVEPGNLDALFEKARSLMGAKYYEDGIKLFDRIIQKDPKYTDAFLYKGVALYNQNRLKEALLQFNGAISADPKYTSPYVWKAKVYYNLRNFKEAEKACNEAVAINPEDSFAYNTLSKIAYAQDKYDEALDFSAKSVKYDPWNEDSVITRASLLYEDGNYSDCVKFIDEAEKNFPDNEDLLWYKGDAKAALLNHEEAIGLYKKVMGFDSENITVLENLAFEYFYLQDYENSIVYTEKALKADPENQSMKYLKNQIKESSLPEAEKVVRFVRNNYLYISKIKNFETLAGEFSKKGDVTAEEVEAFIKSIKLNTDRFTFLIKGQDYDALSREEFITHVDSRSLGPNIYYVQFDSFTHNIVSEFRRAIKGVESSEKKTLVIDLRNNPGGLLESANKILDYLLGDCSTSTTEQRSGSSSSYKSDRVKTSFRKIILLVNENSASGSEILALSLKKHLQNVTILGHRTFGKGVGQVTLENVKKKYALYLTSFRWNVEKTSINDTGITPDIVINGDTDSDYFSEVYRQAAK